MSLENVERLHREMRKGIEDELHVRKEISYGVERHKTLVIPLPNCSRLTYSSIQSERQRARK